MWKVANFNSLSCVYTCEHFVREPVRKHKVHVISTWFVNSSLRTISCRFFRQTQRMFAAQWVPWSSKFVFSSMFAGRFSYLASNFHITAGAVGSSFFPSSPEICEKINFPNMFASGVRECIQNSHDEPNSFSEKLRPMGPYRSSVFLQTGLKCEPIPFCWDLVANECEKVRWDW